MGVSDAPSFGVNYDRTSGESRDIIYYHNIFLIRATNVG